MTRITDTLHEDLWTFVIISRSVPLRMRNFSGGVLQKIRARISCTITLFSENLSVHELRWRNTVESGRPQMTILRTRNACSILKATNTHSEYVIFIVFPLQQWLHERASLLRYTCTGCIVIPCF